MCLICIEFEKQKMSVSEARAALGEMMEQLEPDHIGEVQDMLAQAEVDAAPPSV